VGAGPALKYARAEGRRLRPRPGAEVQIGGVQGGHRGGGGRSSEEGKEHRGGAWHVVGVWRPLIWIADDPTELV